MSKANGLSGRPWVIGIFASGLAACASTPLENTDSLFEKKEFHAPTGTPLTAQTGDAIFVEGTYIDGEALTLSRDVQITLPGTLRVPFPVSIHGGELRMGSVLGGWKYFCAKEGEATASFPGVGSVITHGDCVGVRQSVVNSQLQWVVDNSNYNRSTTIWSRSISAEDTKLLTHTEIGQPFSVRQLTRIVFDGYHGGQFHFSYEAWKAPATKDSKEFVFDRDPSGKTEVGIHGKVFRVTDANNVQMTYEWVKN
jgi:hypothetical protein